MSAALDPPQSLWRRARTSPAWAATTAIGWMLLLTLLVWGGWRTYDSTRQRVLVLSGEAPVGLELYAVGERTGPLLSRDLTQETRARLPRGEYDLRIIGRGRVGDVLTIDLHEDVQSVSTSLDHLRYVEPFEESAYLIPLDLGGQAWIAAISGATGEVLWFAGRGADVLARVTRPADEAASTVLGCPEVVGDLDGDGVDDVLATFLDRRLGNAKQPESWTEAISGATGDVVWKVSIPSADFAGSGVSALASRWFALHADRPRNVLGQKRDEFLVPSPEAARSIAWGGARVAAIVVPEQVMIVDLATGESIGTHWQVPSAIQGVREWRDLDHDGYEDLVGWMKTADSSPGIVAYSVRHQRRLWTWDASPFVTSTMELLAIESLLADLDEDGVDDVLALGTTAQDRHELLVALDGRTGRELWRKRLPASRKLTGSGRLLIGPDIDGDRRREIYLVSVFGRSGSSRVQAISGANGADLWRAVAPNGVVSNAVGASAIWYGRPEEVVQTGWWQAGADGWPQLVVRWECRDEPRRSTTRCFSAGTGAVTHSGRDIDQTLTRDLDGDGVEELLTLRKADEQDERGPWEVTHGSAAIRWRRTSVELATIADINADGCADLLDVTDPQRLRVRDGRTGRLAWESSFSTRKTSSSNATAYGATEASSTRCATSYLRRRRCRRWGLTNRPALKGKRASERFVRRRLVPHDSRTWTTTAYPILSVLRR